MPQNTPYPACSVDKLMNIHRIECAEPPLCSPVDFLSSFDPSQAQGLFSGCERT
jgi:hypothetical protein